MSMDILRALLRRVSLLWRGPADSPCKPQTAMRFCIIYDCLYPWTIGGAERWYRNLALALAQAGHEVTYLTLLQWEAGNEPDLPGVRVVAVGPRMPLYHDGKRRVWPPIRFGIGVLLHLLRQGRCYDKVHTASFPFFSLIAAALARRFSRFTIAVDWHEVWSRAYWSEYLGRLGTVGWYVQKLCAKVPQTAFSFSHLHCERLRAIGFGGEPVLLPGEYAGGHPASQPVAADPPMVVYAGRFILEKRLDLLADALALVMARVPELRATLFGQGPTHAAIVARVTALGLGNRVVLPGFVDEAIIEQTMQEAVAIVQPSSREGYGLVVVEASARGVPAVVVEAPDNAAAELIAPGENGFVAAASASALAEAILACSAGGDALRDRTRNWYAANRRRLSIEQSIDIVLAATATKKFVSKPSAHNSDAGPL
jgi:glycosyltransferase involved in cell wall biosynthesis